MRNFLFIILTSFVAPAFGQSDLVVGTSHSLQIQKQGDHEDAFILHNAQFNSTYPTFSWKVSHGSFGSRGIRFSYVDGIHFYADNLQSTANTVFTPLSKFFIGNNGYVGVGTTTPRGKLDVDGPGDIYLSDELNTGSYQSIFLPGHIFIAPYMGGNTSYLQARRHDSSGSTALQIRTFNNGMLTEAIQVQPNGNVGVGTLNPAHKIHISGMGGFNTDLKVNGRIQTGDGSEGGGVYVNNAGSMFFGQQSPSRMGFFNNGWRLIADNSGNVGIGTLAPDQKLTVKGKIHSEEVIVDLAVPAPDYVFEKNYSLTPLDTLQEYIAQHQHLPEVPSAKEMERDGVKIGEMEMLLLKKIEEMTLHLIQLNNTVNELKRTNIELTGKSAEQERRIQQLEKQ